MEPDPLQPQMCAKRLAALAAPERLRIVRFLRDGPRNAGAIAAFLQIAAVNVSHHMNVLRTAGLVQSEKRGRFVLYSLVPARPTDAARRKQLLTDLGSARFAVRQKAMRELDALGDRARAALRGWLGENPPLEVRQRIEQLLARLDGPQDRPEWLRGLRAVEVLERIGSDEARRFLAQLAGGAPGADLTRQAADARRRRER